jgi:hypothetical protein
MRRSDKKTKANRKNAENSTGPTTNGGKRNSSRNAIKDGFFAKELVFSETEKLEVQSLRRTLCAELSPTTTLQNIGFEEVVCCTWRLRLAVRLEMRRAARFLDGSEEQGAKPESPGGTPVMPNWYLSDRQELRDAIRFVEFVIGDFEENGVVREDWREPLDRAFGVGFHDLLTKWTPMNRTAVLMADFLIRHQENTGMKLPRFDTGVVIDPAQGSQMVGKLLDRELQHLRHLSRSWAQRASQTIDVHDAVADFAPRYFTTASRDLHRAVEWFEHLKELNL